jgi:hypothetical protein
MEINIKKHQMIRTRSFRRSISFQEYWLTLSGFSISVFLLFTVTLNACLPSEERFIEKGPDKLNLFCPGNLPDCYQCLDDGENYYPTTYCLEELVGNWHLEGLQLCINLNDGGTGEITNYQNNLNVAIAWGAKTDETGTLVDTNGNWTVYFENLGTYFFNFPYELSYNTALARLGGDGVKNTYCSMDPEFNTIGSAVIFTQQSSLLPITITLDNEIGVINEVLSSIPDCGASNGFTITGEPGQYWAYVQTSQSSYGLNFSITTNGCQQINLQQ